MNAPQTFLPKKGNYKTLTAYKKAECIYDVTFFFTQNFLGKGDRTIDQMVQAARSGKQNIAEGAAAASTSAETELKLTNVAKASLQELLVDFEDYLRVRGLEQWSLQDPRTSKLQEFCNTHAEPQAFMAAFYEAVDRGHNPNRANEANSANSPKPAPLAEKVANLAITLIHQADVCLRGYINRLEKDFTEQGGIRERMTAARLGYRQGQKEEITRLQAENERLKQRIAWLEQQLEKNEKK